MLELATGFTPLDTSTRFCLVINPKWLSLKVALLCTIVVLPVAVFIGWILARKNFMGKALVEGVLHLLLVLPPVTTGYILLVLLGRNGWIGSFFY